MVIHRPSKIAMLSIVLSHIVEGFTNASASESVNTRGLKRQIRGPLDRQMQTEFAAFKLQASPKKSTRRSVNNSSWLFFAA